MYTNIVKTSVSSLRGVCVSSFQNCLHNVKTKIKPFTYISTCGVQNMYIKRYLSNVNSIRCKVTTEVRLKLEEERQKEYQKLLDDPEKVTQLKILELEVDLLRQSGYKVPEKLLPKHWIYLLATSKNQRRKFLEYLWTIEVKKLKEKERKELKKIEAIEKKQDNETEKTIGAMSYGLCYNTLFPRIYDTRINNMYNHKLMLAMMLDEVKVVMDCGYEAQMSIREINNCAKQLTLAFTENRKHDEPFNLYYCNANPNGYLMKKCLEFIPTMFCPDFPLHVTSESYLDIFDKEKLIYLTPHCRGDLVEFNPDAIYIIGALVDKLDPKPFSMAKAKREGIRMAKFPLDRHIKWGSGSLKSLTINQSLRILLDFRRTKDWNKSFTSVPIRKLKDNRLKKLQAQVFKYEHEADEF